SSRRRHTRSKRDWSSDVCSSDLGLAMLVVAVAVGLPVLLGLADPSVPRAWWMVLYGVYLITLVVVSAVTWRRPYVLAVFGIALEIGRASCRERVDVCGGAVAVKR